MRWLVRHGESTLNAAGIKYGTLNPPLTDHGRRQSADVAEFLRDRIDQIVTSPLRRATEFAEAIADLLDLPHPIRMTGLAERTFGEAEGLTPAEIRDRWPDMDVPGMESTASAATRARHALTAIPDRTAVITHAGVIKGLTGATHVANGQIVPLRLHHLNPR